MHRLGSLCRAGASSVQWTTPAVGLWNEPRNWSPAGPPGPGQVDAFRLGLPEFHTVRLDESVAGDRLRVGPDQVRLDLGLAEHVAATNLFAVEVGLGIAPDEVARLRVEGGSLETGFMHLVNSIGTGAEVLLRDGTARTIDGFIFMGQGGGLASLPVEEGSSLHVSGWLIHEGGQLVECPVRTRFASAGTRGVSDGDFSTFANHNAFHVRDGASVSFGGNVYFITSTNVFH